MSEAVADTVTLLPDTVAEEAGAVSVTVGGVVSAVALDTVTVMAVEVFVFPAASRARADSVCCPLAAVVVFQVTL